MAKVQRRRRGELTVLAGEVVQRHLRLVEAAGPHPLGEVQRRLPLAFLALKRLVAAALGRLGRGKHAGQPPGGEVLAELLRVVLDVDLDRLVGVGIAQDVTPGVRTKGDLQPRLRVVDRVGRVRGRGKDDRPR